MCVYSKTYKFSDKARFRIYLYGNIHEQGIIEYNVPNDNETYQTQVFVGDKIIFPTDCNYVILELPTWTVTILTSVLCIFRVEIFGISNARSNIYSLYSNLFGSKMKLNTPLIKISKLTLQSVVLSYMYMILWININGL